MQDDIEKTSNIIRERTVRACASALALCTREFEESLIALQSIESKSVTDHQFKLWSVILLNHCYSSSRTKHRIKNQTFYVLNFSLCVNSVPLSRGHYHREKFVCCIKCAVLMLIPMQRSRPINRLDVGEHGLVVCVCHVACVTWLVCPSKSVSKRAKMGMHLVSMCVEGEKNALSILWCTFLLCCILWFAGVSDSWDHYLYILSSLICMERLAAFVSAISFSVGDSTFTWFTKQWASVHYNIPKRAVLISRNLSTLREIKKSFFICI